MQIELSDAFKTKKGACPMQTAIIIIIIIMIITEKKQYNLHRTS